MFPYQNSRKFSRTRYPTFKLTDTSWVLFDIGQVYGKGNNFCISTQGDQIYGGFYTQHKVVPWDKQAEHRSWSEIEPTPLSANLRRS